MTGIMNKYKGLLLIGGASRNVGKTTLTCKIINHFSKNHSIVALKIKTIYEGDQFFHGKERNPLNENYKLSEDFDQIGNEDTSKMLKAGAIRAFKLKTKSLFLEQAFDDFTKQIGNNFLIVCESNSLRKILEPDIYLLIKPTDGLHMKPSALELEKFADKIILTDGEQHSFNIHELEIIKNKWILNKKN